MILTGQKNEQAVLIGGAGARLLFLPPTARSQADRDEFAKPKNCCGEPPNRRRLSDLMGRTLNMFTPEECANYVSHRG